MSQSDPRSVPPIGPDAQTDGGAVHNAGRVREPISGIGRSAVRPSDPRGLFGISTAGPAHCNGQSVPDGRSNAPGRGRANGDTFGPAGSIRLAGGPRFDTAVAPGGYAWWYIDAISDDGKHGLTIIAFVGSVFSTWYAESGRMKPENHVSMNVALYSPGAGRWAFTERGEADLERQADAIKIGPSTMRWDGSDLVIQFEEVCAPIPRKIKGTVRVTPEALAMQCFALDAAGKHRWTPISPKARVEVKIDQPGLNWTGSGYVDSNAGDAPLEEGFSQWDWSRAHGAETTSVCYEGERRDGTRFDLALQFDKSGHARQVEPPPLVHLRKTGWRVPRSTRADAGVPVKIIKSWEDAPFYSRTALSTQLYGEKVDVVHESLSLDRLRSPVVRFMVPFRNPRKVR